SSPAWRKRSSTSLSKDSPRLPWLSAIPLRERDRSSESTYRQPDSRPLFRPWPALRARRTARVSCGEFPLRPMPCNRTNRVALTPWECWRISRLPYPSRSSAVKLPTLRIDLCPSSSLKLQSWCFPRLPALPRDDLYGGAPGAPPGAPLVGYRRLSVIGSG